MVAAAVAPVSASDCAVHGTCCFGPPKPPAIAWKSSSTEAVFGRVRVSAGGMSAWEIRRSLGRQAGPIAACFDLPDAIDGAVTVTFVVGASGTVVRADATSAHSKLATCVATAWPRLAVPATRSFAVTQATVTVRARLQRRIGQG